ncbi:hypothetical protein NE852_11085 [Rhizobium sp. Pop5]|uniref:hypothetical protein n=1 Tax=Rhizobium sp. Pop5 TaxID=1223565 RepID=UPI000283CC0D|nr:hypothetical protein [Rhizobium sp. Pop5]EJZ21714.1 hypothetical protein RCCGEPOP_08530 [Rhizobium sp. Pop5]UVD58688.1 hypothetical protein NE852_11085 [Rhizobium sp. Pop5]
MQCARTASFVSVAIIAVTLGDYAYSAEKGERLKPREVTPPAHALIVPLDATVTPPVFSISWWSRVTPAQGIDPPSRLQSDAGRNDAAESPRAE